MASEFRISVEDDFAYVPVKAAFEKLSRGVLPDHDKTVECILNARWRVVEYKRNWPDPELLPTGDQTLKDLHGLMFDVVRKRGASELMRLMNNYKIDSVAELPVNRFVDFYHDLYTAYHGRQSGAGDGG